MSGAPKLGLGRSRPRRQWQVWSSNGQGAVLRQGWQSRRYRRDGSGHHRAQALGSRTWPQANFATTPFSKTWWRGYAFCKLLYEQGKANDFVYLEVNSVFRIPERIEGRVVGKKVSEVILEFATAIPNFSRSTAAWFPLARRRDSELHLPASQRWFAFTIYSMEDDHFVIVFDNITERKLARNTSRPMRRCFGSSFNTRPLPSPCWTRRCATFRSARDGRRTTIWPPRKSSAKRITRSSRKSPKGGRTSTSASSQGCGALRRGPLSTRRRLPSTGSSGRPGHGTRRAVDRRDDFLHPGHHGPHISTRKIRLTSERLQLCRARGRNRHLGARLLLESPHMGRSDVRPLRPVQGRQRRPFRTLDHEPSRGRQGSRPRRNSRTFFLGRGSELFDTEFRIIRQNDGEIRFIRAIANLLHDESGKPWRLVGTNWDITEERLRERTLAEALTHEMELSEKARAGVRAKAEIPRHDEP